MGAEAVDTRHVAWLTPLPLWAGILTGPVVWAVDLTASYALAGWACRTGHQEVLLLLAIGSLGIIAGATMISAAALARTRHDVPTDGGRPRQRARFMALLGLATSALFALQVIAAAYPVWVLDACQ